ncbi:hypothetical protein IQ07DRAFT_628698 [Pyrenochaeta sp. DS3sAY3a]|nr:hypothetical protein IQ07DRAFT_628698 [Pyrenochaeta sp. DS3sAY3a]
MQLTLAVLSGLAIAASGLAVRDDRSISFTTWPCLECGGQPDGTPCVQAPYQNQKPDNVCRPLKSTSSIRVNPSVPVSAGCYVALYNTSNCSDDPATFPGDSFCKPIAFPAQYYKVICS